MNNGELNLIKLKTKNNYKKRQEIKTQILKSITQNKKIKPIYRSYASIMLQKRVLTKYKFKHVCLKNNRHASVLNKFYISRHFLKNLALENRLQNVKLNNW